MDNKEKKEIQEILGIVNDDKVQTSVKLPVSLVADFTEAADLLDIFYCDLHEVALRKLLDELKPKLDALKAGGKKHARIQKHGARSSTKKNRSKAHAS